MSSCAIESLGLFRRAWRCRVVPADLIRGQEGTTVGLGQQASLKTGDDIVRPVFQSFPSELCAGWICACRKAPQLVIRKSLVVPALVIRSYGGEGT